MLSGVGISDSSNEPDRNPAIIKTAHTIPLDMNDVYTAVFISVSFLAPKSWETITEHPMLHPKANAIKISVIS